MPYIPDFINGISIKLPVIPASQQNDIVQLLNGNGHVIDYYRHSVVLSKKRKFAFYSASNIAGESWKKIDRHGDFKKDSLHINPKTQLGEELYNAIRQSTIRPNDFEQGHLTSFQEVLWGENDDEREKAAADTFFYTNCVPQHERLNSGLWRSLEQYILKTETVEHGLKVTVMTGPLLSDRDPYYIQKVSGKFVQLPCVFWKVIYYPNAQGLNAVGFMMSHKQLMLQDETVTFNRGAVRNAALRRVAEDYFMDYRYDSVYQVKVEFIAQETGLTFMLNNVRLPYQQEVQKDVIYKRIDLARLAAARRTVPSALDFQLLDIAL